MMMSIMFFYNLTMPMSMMLNIIIIMMLLILITMMLTMLMRMMRMMMMVGGEGDEGGLKIRASPPKPRRFRRIATQKTSGKPPLIEMQA